MTQVYTIGMDIAKNKFQVHGEDQHGKRIFSRQLLRKDVLTFSANLPHVWLALKSVLEACGGVPGPEHLLRWDTMQDSFHLGR